MERRKKGQGGCGITMYGSGHSRVHILLWPKCWISSCLDILHTPMLSDFSSPLMPLATRQAQSHSKLGGGADGRDTCNMLVSC